MEKHVYFVRHGESESNRDNIALGAASKLTDRGRAQAEIIAGRIERIGVEALVASPYPRTLATAEAISKRVGLPIEPNQLFIEWERQSMRLGRSWLEPEIQQLNADLFKGYETSDDFVHSDEEPFTKLRARGFAALEFLEDHPAGRICVVSHGIFMRVLFGLTIFGDAFTAVHFMRMFERLDANNTGVTVLRFDDKHGWTGETWNDSAHLG